MRNAVLAIIMFLGFNAAAAETGTFFFDPHVAVGYNVAQGTYFMVGADAGYALTDQIDVGVGGFYSAGKRPEHDRAIGAGPFASYYQPLASFLAVSVREDISYIDQRNPYLITSATGQETYGHTNEYGVASITSVGVHLTLTPNLGISAGYRAVLALSNSAISKDRSGTFFGIAFGI